jgi:hypothetical protein
VSGIMLGGAPDAKRDDEAAGRAQSSVRWQSGRVLLPLQPANTGLSDALQPGAGENVPAAQSEGGAKAEAAAQESESLVLQSMLHIVRLAAAAATCATTAAAIVRVCGESCEEGTHVEVDVSL